MSTPVLFSGSWTNILLYFIPILSFLVLLWLCLARGIYITLNENSLFNTFCFVRRNTISLSQIVSLTARHAMLPLGKATQVWNTFYDASGQLRTKGLVTRETLKGKDFHDLMEKIHKTNPGIKIDEELLQSPDSHLK